jgi:hypothetical protein
MTVEDARIGWVDLMRESDQAGNGLCHAETRLPDFGGRDSQVL